MQKTTQHTGPEQPPPDNTMSSGSDTYGTCPRSAFPPAGGSPSLDLFDTEAQLTVDLRRAEQDADHNRAHQLRQELEQAQIRTRPRLGTEYRRAEAVIRALVANGKEPPGWVISELDRIDREFERDVLASKVTPERRVGRPKSEPTTYHRQQTVEPTPGGHAIPVEFHAPETLYDQLDPDDPARQVFAGCPHEPYPCEEDLVEPPILDEYLLDRPEDNALETTDRYMMARLFGFGHPDPAEAWLRAAHAKDPERFEAAEDHLWPCPSERERGERRYRGAWKPNRFKAKDSERRQDDRHPTRSMYVTMDGELREIEVPDVPDDDGPECVLSRDEDPAFDRKSLRHRLLGYTPPTYEQLAQQRKWRKYGAAFFDHDRHGHNCGCGDHKAKKREVDPTYQNLYGHLDEEGEARRRSELAERNIMLRQCANGTRFWTQAVPAPMNFLHKCPRYVEGDGTQKKVGSLEENDADPRR